MIPTMSEFDAWYAAQIQIDPMAEDGPTFDGCSHGSSIDALVVGVLGLCGCGSDEPKRMLAKLCLALLHADRTPHSTVWYTHAPDLDRSWPTELALHVLDKARLTEHGGSVNGSWLSEYGRRILGQVFEGAKVIE